MDDQERTYLCPLGVSINRETNEITPIDFWGTREDFVECFKPFMEMGMVFWRADQARERAKRLAKAE